MLHIIIPNFLLALPWRAGGPQGRREERMRKYETVLVFRPDLSEDQIGAVMERLKGRVESTGGKPISINEWGTRRLAYTIMYRGERFQRGNYLVFNYLGEGGIVNELNRMTRLMDEVVRTMTVMKEEEVDPATITEMTITRESQAEPGTGSKEEPEAKEDKGLAKEAMEQEGEEFSKENAHLEESSERLDESDEDMDSSEQEKEEQEL
jgi:small subunit ribosomal protein S6